MWGWGSICSHCGPPSTEPGFSRGPAPPARDCGAACAASTKPLPGLGPLGLRHWFLLWGPTAQPGGPTRPLLRAEGQGSPLLPGSAPWASVVPWDVAMGSRGLEKVGGNLLAQLPWPHAAGASVALPVADVRLPQPRGSRRLPSPSTAGGLGLSPDCPAPLPAPVGSAPSPPSARPGVPAPAPL